MIKPNWTGIAKVESFIMAALGLAMLPPLFICIFENESQSLLESFAFLAALCFVSCYLLNEAGSKMKKPIDTRDGMLVVFIGWVSACIIGAIPYYVAGALTTPMNAFFESVSGFSTTAVSLIDVLENVPRALLMWRSETQWLGGVGVVVVIIAVIPTYGRSSDSMLTIESPGGRSIKVFARSATSAKTIIAVYAVLTLVQAVLLVFGGLSFFDALTLAFSSISSAGFTNYSDGIRHFGSSYVEIILMIFMFLSCVSFVLYGNVLRREWNNIKKNSELKTYIVIIIATSVLVCLSLALSHTFESGKDLFRYGIFESIAFATTTGHAATDLRLWPSFAKGILTIVSFIGGCSVSTGCGIKVFRTIVVFKIIKKSFVQRLHPNAVVSIKVDGEALSNNTLNSAVAYIMTFTALLFAGTLIIALECPDMSASLATAGALLSNTGTSFSYIAYGAGYNVFSDPVKFVMCILMLAGRLEIYSLFVIFTRDFWNLDN